MNDRERRIITDFFELLFEKLSPKELQESKPQAEPERKKRLIPFTKWNEHHTYPTIGQLRHFRLYGHKTGFNEACVRKVGKRLYVDERAFFEWFEKQGRGNPRQRNLGRPPEKAGRPLDCY